MVTYVRFQPLFHGVFSLIPGLPVIVGGSCIRRRLFRHSGHLLRCNSTRRYAFSSSGRASCHFLRPSAPGIAVGRTDSGLCRSDPGGVSARYRFRDRPIVHKHLCHWQSFLLLSLAIHFALKSRRHTREISCNDKKLEIEISERKFMGEEAALILDISGHKRAFEALQENQRVL